jgi:hypothetical protein
VLQAVCLALTVLLFTLMRQNLILPALNNTLTLNGQHVAFVDLQKVSSRDLFCPTLNPKP